MISICFILPARGASGGANSVVQEALQLSKMGAEVAVAVDKRYEAQFRENYVAALGAGLKVAFYQDEADLLSVTEAFQILVATVNPTVAAVKRILEARPKAGHVAAYYVQDYEPLFYAPYTDAWNVASASYTLIPHCLMFAKTDWIRRMVYKNHGVRVAAVRPSIDHARFYPGPRQDGEVTVTAMIRPSTPRRAPRRTVAVFNALARQQDRTVRLRTFGCSDEELDAAGLRLSSNIEHLGRLKPGDVAEVLRQSDMFVDASDYQAFGRTALEGMACGCIPLVPLLGGADEFAVHGRNAFQIDTRSTNDVYAGVLKFLDLDDKTRGSMRTAAMRTASEYSVTNAAASELELFWGARA